MSDSGPNSGFQLYHYSPSTPAAVIFVVLFVGTTGMHTFQLVRNRTWYFIPFVIGGFFEFIGYIGRTMSSRETFGQWTIGPYIIQSLLLLLAPALFAASIYMVLARIIILTDGQSHSLIRVNWITKIFVTGDVLSFLAQSSGGGMLAKAKTREKVKMGENIIIGGLGIQILVFGFFIIVSAAFNMRIRKAPTAKSQSITVPWQQHLLVLYAASALIMVRSIFRVAEYVMGRDGILLQHEYYLYIFDAVLMFAAMVLFNIWHPSKIIERKKVGDFQEQGQYQLEENSSPAFNKHYNNRR